MINLAQVLPPSPPTSERPEYSLLYTTANTLNSDILLRIFDICRLDDEAKWNLQTRWCTLSHVCRKWRHLIHESFFHLNMHVLFTNGTPPLDMLAHLPPLPLVINYRSGDPTETDTGVLQAIQQRDRIRRIVLQASAMTLDKWILLMDAPFLSLETLSLLSTTIPEEGTSPALPRSFLAPNIRRLDLRGVFLSTRLSLLTTTHFLTTLKLTEIQGPGYFTPDDLVTQLQHLLQLEELFIGFSTPMPRPNAEGELSLPPMPLTILPTLRRLGFRGVSAYLESLIARISAPFLERFDITLFNQLTFTLPNLTQFTGTTERLRLPVANIVFDRGAVSVVVSSGEQSGEATLSFQISCKHLDWQIDSATQVCAALVPIISAAEELTLDFEEQSLPSDWQNDVDDMVWHELLGPFNGVKKLCIGYPFASEFSSAMQSDDPQLVLGLLPELQELEAELEVAETDEAFAVFIEARQLASRPVRLSVSRVLPALDSEPSPTFSPVSLTPSTWPEPSPTESSPKFSPVSLVSPSEKSLIFTPVSLTATESIEPTPSFSPVSLTPVSGSSPSNSPMSLSTPIELSTSLSPTLIRVTAPTEPSTPSSTALLTTLTEPFALFSPVSPITLTGPYTPFSPASLTTLTEPSHVQDEGPQVLRPASDQNNWFRRTVVNPFLKRLGPRFATGS